MSRRIIVAGAEPLGLAIVDRLVRAGAQVTVLTASGDDTRYGHELKRAGARVVVGSATAPGELLEAGVADADALVLTEDGDAGNVDAALAARRLRPDLLLVVRVYDPGLAAYLRATLDRVEVLSVSVSSAPVFAELALRALAGADQLPAAPRRARRRHARPPRVDRVIVVLAVAPLGLVVLFTAYFARALDLRSIDALYFVWTTMMTVGYGDISLRTASDTAKIVGMALMAVGAALVAVLYALLAGWVLARRLEIRHGRVPVRGRGHVVIIGAGDVGAGVARLLAAGGRRVVIVEADPEGPRLSDLRGEGHHVIIADGLVEETLDLAAIDRAAVVVAVTDSDAANLHVALAVRRRRPELGVVVRLLSQELSAHVTERGDALAASSVAIGSEAFARAALAEPAEGAGAHP